MTSYLKEMYTYRSLIYALVERHLASRYRGSFLGFLWSFLNPLCLMLVYTLVFRYYIRFDHVENYAVFLFCGLLPWIWFSSALAEGTTSIVSSGHLVTKSMFPAHLLPTVTVITAMIHFLLSLPLLFLFMYFSSMPFYPTLFLLPAIVFAQFFLLYGLALLLSALNVYFRDVQHIVGNLLTFLFFLCPILYPKSSVPEKFQFSLEYNPLAQLTVFYHNLILDGAIPSFWPVVYYLLCSFVVVALGMKIFSLYRESFAELL